MKNIGPVVLASSSPRRQELLTQIGVKFEVHPVNIDESCLPHERPEVCVERLAVEKAQAALKDYPEAAVVGSDTMVVVDDQVFFKPVDRDDALRMLECLSGRSHEVLTAVAVATKKRVESIVQRSTVTFSSIEAEEASRYWETGEPADKAGGYGIQGLGARFIKHLEGSYSGVMGLPLYETIQLLRRHGIDGLDI